MSEREQALEKALRAFIDWGDRQCPCKNEEPNPCPLCGASVENLEACKAVDSKFPRRLLADARSALIRRQPEKPEAVETGEPVAFRVRLHPEFADSEWFLTQHKHEAYSYGHNYEIRPLYEGAKQKALESLLARVYEHLHELCSLIDNEAMKREWGDDMPPDNEKADPLYRWALYVTFGELRALRALAAIPAAGDAS